MQPQLQFLVTKQNPSFPLPSRPLPPKKRGLKGTLIKIVIYRFFFFFLEQTKFLKLASFKQFSLPNIYLWVNKPRISFSFRLWAGGEWDRLTSRKTDRLINRQRDRLIDRKTDGHRARIYIIYLLNVLSMLKLTHLIDSQKLQAEQIVWS